MRIDRDWLRDNDTVWIYGKDLMLDIRKVTVKRRDPDVVYVSHGLKEGEQIVTSDLAVRIAGTPLKIDAPASQPTSKPMSQPASQPTSKPGDSPK